MRLKAFEDEWYQVFQVKDSDSSFELTIWQKEMVSNSVIEQTYLKPFLLDQHHEVAVTQINLRHTWINVDNEEDDMKLITKWKNAEQRLLQDCCRCRKRCAKSTRR